MLSIIYVEGQIQVFYAECHYAECHYAEYRFAQCFGALNKAYKRQHKILKEKNEGNRSVVNIVIFIKH
jgi:hypothetical protein